MAKLYEGGKCFDFARHNQSSKLKKKKKRTVLSSRSIQVYEQIALRKKTQATRYVCTNWRNGKQTKGGKKIERMFYTHKIHGQKHHCIRCRVTCYNLVRCLKYIYIFILKDLKPHLPRFTWTVKPFFFNSWRRISNWLTWSPKNWCSTISDCWFVLSLCGQIFSIGKRQILLV